MRPKQRLINSILTLPTFKQDVLKGDVCQNQVVTERLEESQKGIEFDILGNVLEQTLVVNFAIKILVREHQIVPKLSTHEQLDIKGLEKIKLSSPVKVIQYFL